MDNAWQWLRMINFVILFIAFMVMMYKGAYRLFVDPESFNPERMMNLVWTTVVILGTGEVLYQDTRGGVRIIVTCAAAILQLYLAVFKFKAIPGHEYVKHD